MARRAVGHAGQPVLHVPRPHVLQGLVAEGGLDVAPEVPDVLLVGGAGEGLVVGLGRRIEPYLALGDEHAPEERRDGGPGVASPVLVPEPEGDQVPVRLFGGPPERLGLLPSPHGVAQLPHSLGLHALGAPCRTCHGTMHLPSACRSVFARAPRHPPRFSGALLVYIFCCQEPLATFFVAGDSSPTMTAEDRRRS